MHFTLQKPFNFVLPAMIVLLLVACAWQNPIENVRGAADGAPAVDVVIHKSANDSRRYRYLPLANGLQVLLISDPDTDKAAASLSVNFGSFQNPPERQGLAHFLEHMLFLGTEKYPEPDEYQAFISEHGGSHNAYTSMEETNYFFDVDANFLIPVLDRFSQFFIAPLFNQDYVDREQHAVESEYRLKIKEDNYREWDVLRELVNAEHPLSGFSVGNLETLADRQGDPVRQDLINFYQQFYSANQMQLVVLGRESLDVLASAVASRFGQIPNRNAEVTSTEIPLFADQLPLRVYIRPIQEKHELSFLFPVPSDSDYWQTKPLEYLGHLLGHEGPGSLLISLKSRGLAEALAAGKVYDSRVGAAFAITIALTPAGVQQAAVVERDVFAWLRLVREQGIAEWRYQEIASLGKVAFEFQEKIAPASYVRRISTEMQGLPAAEVLRSRTSYYRFDRPLIRRYAALLEPGNALITLIDPGVVTDRESALYGAPYRSEPVDRADQLAWREGIATELRLPDPNPYIPEQLAVPESGADEYPRRIPGYASNALWCYRDGIFRTPKTLFDVRIATPEAESIRGQAMLDLYLALVRDQLVPEVYPAQLAGLGFSIGQWENGVSFSLEGYSDKQPLLLDKVLYAMRTPDWQLSRFQRVKAGLLRDWRNSVSEGPMGQAFSQLRPLLRGISHPLQRAHALEGVSQQELRDFTARLYRRGHARFYAGGTLEVDVARSMMQKTLAALALGEHGDAALEYRVRSLAENSQPMVFELPLDHPDAAVVLYLQGRVDSLEERARMALLQKVTEAPFYSSLRTEKQLGYQVGNTIAHFNRVPGLAFYIQSPVADSARLQAEINAFIEGFGEQIMQIGEAELSQLKIAVLSAIEEKPRSLRQLAGRHLESLDLDFTGFDFRTNLAAEIRKIDLETFRQSYRALIQDSPRSLWVMTRSAPGLQLSAIAAMQRSNLARDALKPASPADESGTVPSPRVFRYPQ